MAKSKIKAAPNSKESEMMVLGCMLTNTNSLEAAADALDSDDFYYTEHQSIFQVLKNAYKQSKPADVHLVCEELKRIDKLDSVGGAAYVTTLAQYAGTSAYIEEYVEIVKSKSILRRMIKAAQVIEKNALEEPQDVDGVLEDAQQLFAKLPQIKDITARNEDFHFSLGKIIKNQDIANKLKDRTYHRFEEEHRKLFAAGGLITGFQKLDEIVHFSRGDFVIIQGMSNHGKSTFMLQTAHRFLSEPANAVFDPMVVLVTYESTPLRVEEKFVNLLGHELREGSLLLYQGLHKDTRYLYAGTDARDFQKSVGTYNNYLKDNRLHFLPHIPLEKLERLIDLYKSKYPARTLVLMLDYIQIIEHSLRSDGWEKVKEISYTLEKLANKKEIVLFAASQVNADGEAREGRDIYNSATTVIDVFNHSHSGLKGGKNENRYKESLNGKNICTVNLKKQKHGSSGILEHYLLFNGYCFSENKHNIENHERSISKAIAAAGSKNPWD